LIPKAAGHQLLAHSILVPNPYPDDVTAAVRLSAPGTPPVYGALHGQVPEFVVERDEVAG
jgi:hypothetical protein